MNSKLFMRELLLLSCLSMLGGCSGQHPSRIVQICLGDKGNVAAFKDVMRSIAREKGIEFVDGGANTEKDLAALKKHPGYTLIYIGMRGKDGVGLEAGNLGLSAYEVAIGFSGSDRSDSRQFENDVIQELSKRWQIHTVPPGQGAFSLPGCSGASRVSGSGSLPDRKQKAPAAWLWTGSLRSPMASMRRRPSSTGTISGSGSLPGRK